MRYYRIILFFEPGAKGYLILSGATIEILGIWLGRKVTRSVQCARTVRPQDIPVVGGGMTVHHTNGA